MRAIRIALLASIVLAAPAFAAPQVNGVFDMPGVQTNGQLTAGPDGNIWVALQNAVGKVQPDGTVEEFNNAQLNNTLGFPQGGIVSAGGFVWVSQNPDLGGQEAIVKIPPTDPATATSISVTNVTQGTSAMTVGPDGNIWVAVPGKLVKFAPSDPTQSTPYVFIGLQPKAIVAGSDSTLWVTDGSNGGQLLNVKTDGTPVHDPYPTGGSPQFLATAPSGQVTVSLPINDPQQIGQLVPGGNLTTIDRPIPADPFGVAFGNDGAFWVAMFAGNRLDRVTTDGQLTSLTGFPDVSGQGPRQITAGPGNTLWATLDNPAQPGNSQIARITGVEPPPTGGGGPGGGGGGPGGGTPPPDTTPPVISAARFAKAKVPAGTKFVTLRFTIGEPGTAMLVLKRRLPGKRRGNACVKPTRKLRRAKSCTRFVTVKSVKTTAVAGQNAIRLRVKTLPRGSYRATLTAADAAGNQAVPLTRTLTITKKRPRR